MSPTDALVSERACERLIVDSASFNDQRAWSALAGLYTPDGVVVRPNGQRLEGRDAIEAAYAAGSSDRVTRHLCTNLRVDVDDADSAHATTTVLIASGTRGDDPNVTFRVGEFADRFVRTDEGWRIAERRASLMTNS
jgi:uncharacterized protein (TIGR02246 family)